MGKPAFRSNSRLLGLSRRGTRGHNGAALNLLTATMKPTVILLALVLGILLDGCTGRLPGAVPAAPEASVQIRKINMLDARAGWAWANGAGGPRVLRTSDGGRAWNDVTPHPFTKKVWDCQFPKSPMAWISFYDQRSRWLLTTNAGTTWEPWAPLDVGSNDTHNYFLAVEECRFYDGNLGIAKLCDFGAGTAVYNFFETRDGGMSWKAVEVTPRNPNHNAGVAPGTFFLSNISGDNIGYCPPGKFIVTYGDSPDLGRPKHSVRLSLTTDSGNSWRDLQLRLPDEYREAFAQPQPPVFFGARDGLLPVRVFTEQTNSHTCLALLFYRTGDAGQTWTARRPLAAKEGSWAKDCVALSANQVIVRNGRSLYLTHDGAGTWRVVKPNIDLGAENSDRDVVQMDFVDAKHGWIIISDNSGKPYYGNFALYKTSSGGKTWTELPLRMSRRY